MAHHRGIVYYLIESLQKYFSHEICNGAKPTVWNGVLKIPCNMYLWVTFCSHFLLDEGWTGTDFDGTFE